jgi:hypothetical protein
MKKIFWLYILIICTFTLNYTYAVAPTVTYNFDGSWKFTYDSWASVVIVPYFCQNTDKFIAEGHWASDWWWDWHWTTMMYWTRTSWWKWVSIYCMHEWYWASSWAANLNDIWEWKSFTFTIKTTWPYKWELVWKNDYDYVSVKWSQSSTTKTITSPTFNSPFIYFKNLPTWNIKLNIDSEWQNYTNETPTFNADNWWNLLSDWKSVSVDNQKTDKLFYELALKKVELTRNWKNFASKEELVSFLRSSDFFDKLWFSEGQKEDSLNYILPKIWEAKNYYLTILEDTSINNISKLNVFPTPNNIVRKYFAIYPTSLPVKTYGDIVYPQIGNENGFTIYENGEIYLDNDTFVIWK